jgi:hypothetical protein
MYLLCQILLGRMSKKGRLDRTCFKYRIEPLWFLGEHIMPYICFLHHKKTDLFSLVIDGYIAASMSGMHMIWYELNRFPLRDIRNFDSLVKLMSAHYQLRDCTWQSEIVYSMSARSLTVEILLPAHRGNHQFRIRMQFAFQLNEVSLLHWITFNAADIL